MTTMSRIEYRRLRAPQHHGEAFIEPPLADAGAIRRLPLRTNYDCQGIDLADLIQQARAEAVQAAAAYTSRYRDLPDGSDDMGRPILMAGHQPDLFHPGVWLKNFVLDSLGRSQNAHRINVLIDNDIVKNPSLRIPTGSPQRTELSSVRLNRNNAAVPYEEKEIVDRPQFAGFGAQVIERLRPLIPDPLVGQLWQHVGRVMRDDRQAKFGQVLARARHQLEGDWGLSTLEVPLSDLADTPGFRWFSCHLLADLPRFWEIYNSSLSDYRRLHKLRSRSHPVPDLQQRDGWLEAPFWMWDTNSLERRRVFAQLINDCLKISDLQGTDFCLPVTAERSAADAVAHLARLKQSGIKLRPRALVTTMYFRTLLSDTFIHGIGGAKYDQLTDLMVQRFFGLAAPRFFVVSGTFHLPIDRPAVRVDDLRQVESRLRDLIFNPQRWLPDDAPEAKALRSEKENWINTKVEKGRGRQRHLAITQLNQRMQPLVETERRELKRRRAELQNQLRQRAVLASREFSFCLFPEQTLRPLLESLSKAP